jgi:hypothetical protein
MTVKTMVGQKVAVHCKTKEEAMLAVNLFHDSGITWRGGADRKVTHFDEDGDGSGICYDVEEGIINWADHEWFTQMGFPTISIVDLLTSNSTMRSISDVDAEIH